MNMQADLPWSVAGIPPEAREAARAAARREGLAVGEWLTRRILRSYTDATASGDAERAAWQRDVVEAVRNPAPEPVPARDTQEMLARVSRSESETQNAYTNIDQQMKAVARRLEATERNQSENSRAMNKAATQINIAAREQAQAFDQLTGHVTGLADRLTRMERGTANDGMKDAVKGLHQGLARVADQVAQTANQSAQQIAALASTVEQLAAKLVEARSEAEAATQGYRQQVAALDERIRVVERTAYASAAALDRTLEDVERMRAAKEAGIVETQRHSGAVADLSGQIDQLHQRLAAAEAQNAGAQARFEETARQLQTNAQDTAFDRRFAGIEHALSDIVGRIDMAERTSTQASGGVEQSVRDLTARLEAADKRNRDTVAELQTALRDANTKIVALEGNPVVGAAPVAPTAAPAMQQSFAPSPAPAFAAPAPTFAEPAFDAPPFPEPATAQADGFEPPPFDHSPPPFATDGFAAAPPFGADAFAANAAQAAGEAGNESFIAAARRSARTAAAAEPPAPAGGFSWGFANRSDSNAAATASTGGSRVKYALLAVVAVIAMIVVAAALMLSRGVVAPVPNAATPATSGPFAARPSIAPPSRTDDEAPASQNQTASSANTANATSPSTPAASPKPQTSASAAKPAPMKPVATAQAPAATPPAAATPQSPADKLTAMANTGDAKSQLLLGVKYLDGNGVPVNEAEAARWLARAAQQGEPLAQYRLGTLYERGKGVPANAKQATHWYELAAKQGNRKAMHNLAVAFAEGSGEPKDYAQAAAWFTRAANLGLADSQFNLAVLYERGMGVKQSLVDAYKWYAIAASQGDTESKARIDALSTQISDADRTAAQAAAASFKPQPINAAANSLPASAG